MSVWIYNNCLELFQSLFFDHALKNITHGLHCYKSILPKLYTEQNRKRLVILNRKIDAYIWNHLQQNHNFMIRRPCKERCTLLMHSLISMLLFVNPNVKQGCGTQFYGHLYGHIARKRTHWPFAITCSNSRGKLSQWQNINGITIHEQKCEKKITISGSSSVYFLNTFKNISKVL